METLDEGQEERVQVNVPSAAEILKLLHITDCELIAPTWQDEWTLCPVCGGQRGEDGFIRHKGFKN